jgi:hypothetical protein
MAHLEGGRIIQFRRLPRIASVILGRQWPALQHHRPAVPSSTWRPSSVV